MQPTDRGPVMLKLKMLKVIQTCVAAVPDHSPLHGLLFLISLLHAILLSKML
jgi:hypothetical protein